MSHPALTAFAEAERQTFLRARPRSVALAAQASRHLAGGVPMHWMRDWPLPVPLYVQHAHGAVLTDVDGNSCIDYCLGDTGAMFGHSPPALAQVLAGQAGQGLATMLPSAQVAQVGERLAGLFGLPWWQLAQTATDANRAVLRLARFATGRPRILVFDGCYHGTLDETLAVAGDAGQTLPRPGQIGRVHDPALTTIVVEFNDSAGVEAALARGDVACVLAEPVMTNAGMVLPEPGFLAALQAACLHHDVPLALDETHTLSTGLGGYTRTHGLSPDFLVCGKAIAGGLPCAVYGYTESMAQRLRAADARREPGHSGIGTTLSANPLAVAALDVSLAQLHTSENYRVMEVGAARLGEGIVALLARHGLHWHVSRIGARLEFATGAPPRTARASLAAIDHGFNAVLHLALLNRGILVTPFHNMMLVSPATTAAQIDATLEVLDAVFGELLAGMRAA